MSSTKPLDVVILSNDQDRSIGGHGEPYREYEVKTKMPTNDWWCYIVAEEGKLFSVRCTNTTEKLLVVRICADSCYIQQYLLRPRGEAGDSVTCDGTGSHSMGFHLVSGLTRIGGNRHSRLASETGCINVTVYQSSGNGTGLPPPEKPTERLELPLNMDGTFTKLCVKLAGSEFVFGEPSPHAAEINKLGWKLFASLNFGYRTEGELSSNRIRGIEKPMKQESLVDTNTTSSTGKRKRESMGDGTPRRRQVAFPSSSWKVDVPTTKANNPTSSTTNPPEIITSTVHGVRTRPIIPASVLLACSGEILPFGESSPTSVLSDIGPVSKGLEKSPFISWPLDRALRADSDMSDSPLQEPTGQPSMELSSNPPAVRTAEPATEVVGSIPIRLPQPQPTPLVLSSVAVPTITPSSTLHDRPELEKHTLTSTSGSDRVVPTLTTFLHEASPFRPLDFLAKDLQEEGISTLAELKVIARKPEAFRTKIAVLANLRERDEYLWFMFRKGLRKLLEEDNREQSADDPIHERDPIRKFVRSLGGGECIDLEAFASGLRGAGISSERDLLVLSRNLEKYTKNIPFLREFAASKKLGWTIFQIGIEGLPGRETVQIRGLWASNGGRVYVKRFLDTIDFDKPLGHLTDGFIKAGLNDRLPLIHIADDIEYAVDVMPFLQDLASGDQLVWAMILVGLEDLVKSV